MRRDYRRFQKRDTEILSIGPDDAERFREYWEKEQLPFVGLADPEHRVADRYGQAVRLLKLGRMPSQVLVDQTGTIRYRHDGGSMSDIPANRDVLREIDAIRADASG